MNNLEKKEMIQEIKKHAMKAWNASYKEEDEVCTLAFAIKYSNGDKVNIIIGIVDTTCMVSSFVPYCDLDKEKMQKILKEYDFPIVCIAGVGYWSFSSIVSYEEFKGHIEMMDVWVQTIADVAQRIIATCKLR